MKTKRSRNLLFHFSFSRSHLFLFFFFFVSLCSGRRALTEKEKKTQMRKKLRRNSTGVGGVLHTSRVAFGKVRNRRSFHIAWMPALYIFTIATHGRQRCQQLIKSQTVATSTAQRKNRETRRWKQSPWIWRRAATNLNWKQRTRRLHFIIAPKTIVSLSCVSLLCICSASIMHSSRVWVYVISERTAKSEQVRDTRFKISASVTLRERREWERQQRRSQLQQNRQWKNNVRSSRIYFYFSCSILFTFRFHDLQHVGTRKDCIKSNENIIILHRARLHWQKSDDLTKVIFIFTFSSCRRILFAFHAWIFRRLCFLAATPPSAIDA